RHRLAPIPPSALSQPRRPPLDTPPRLGPLCVNSTQTHHPGDLMDPPAAPTGPALERLLAPLGDSTYTTDRCAALADVMAEIQALKSERRAVILAHNYQRPEIFEVADFIGDSLELARNARDVRDADMIVFCGVHFMAETAKVFNPDRTVLLPDMRAGCSLADSITADALAERKQELREI